MHERLRARLEELRREFDAGQTRFREIETQHAQLRETLLRISGAIQVLEELLTDLQLNGQGRGGVVESAAAAARATGSG